MYHKHTVVGQRLVGALQLAVLEDVILVLVLLVEHHVRLLCLVQRLHVLHVARLAEDSRLEPSAHPLLVRVVAHRRIAVAAVRSVVHQVPSVHAEAATVLRVVHIGYAHTVTELVAGGADAADVCARSAVQLRRASVGVDAHAAQTQTVASRLQVPLVRPNGVSRSARSLAVAGIDNVNLVGSAVAVPVILRHIEFLLSVSQLASLLNHARRIDIVAVSVVGTVRIHVLRNRHRSHNVKLKVELAVALLVEVVVHRSVVAVVLVALLVEVVLPLLQRVLRLHLLVLKVHKNHQALALARYADALAAGSASHNLAHHRLARSVHSVTLCEARNAVGVALLRTLHAERAHLLRLCRIVAEERLLCRATAALVVSHLRRGCQHAASVERSIAVGTVGTLHQRLTVFGTCVMEILVAAQHHSEHGAVRLLHLTLHTLRRNGKSRGCKHKHCSEC